MTSAQQTVTTRPGTTVSANEATAIPPGYKQTEVGVIPQDWEVQPVGCMGEVVTGKALAVNGPGQQRPYLRTKNVFDGRIDISDVLTMPMTDAMFAHFMLLRSDVLLNEGQSLDLVGRCAIYQDEYPRACAIQNQLLRFRAKAGVSALFASHLFRYSQETGVFARIALQTTSIAHLGGSRFTRLQLPWPKSRVEQHAIAEALSDADKLIEVLEKLIAKKWAIKQATMQQLLTGQVRLTQPLAKSTWGNEVTVIPPGYKQTEVGVIPADWSVEAISSIADVKTGPFGSALHERDYVDDGTPIITVEHLNEYGISHHDLPLVSDADRCRLKSYKLRSGDIVFSRVGSIDRNALVSEKEAGWLFSGRLLRVRTSDDATFSPYLSYHFHSELFKKRVRSVAVGQTMASLNTQILKAVYVVLPPTAEQRAIAAALSDMDAAIAALERRRDKTRAIKQGMMQQLLTGRVRLVKPARTTEASTR